MLKRYVAYLKDNPKGYWFRRKLYGWGWTPATWQGWLITAAYVLLVVMLSRMATGHFMMVNGHLSAGKLSLTLILPIALLTAAFIVIAYKTGESPRWQWGEDKKDSK